MNNSVHCEEEKEMNRLPEEHGTTWDTFLIGIGIFILVIVILGTASPVRAGAPTDSLKATLDHVIEVLNDQTMKTPETKKKRAEILHKLLTDRFDADEFAKRALGPHWKKRTDQEKKEFTRLFIALMERTYFEKIDGYVVKIKTFSKDNILYTKERVKGSSAIVETKVLLDKDTEIPVFYRMKNRAGKWRVCDVAVEGVSLLKNYRVQFTEIIANSSFSDLMERLRSKRQQ